MRQICAASRIEAVLANSKHECVDFPTLSKEENVAYTRFKADRDMMDALVNLSKKRGAGGSNRRRASPADATLGHTLC